VLLAGPAIRRSPPARPGSRCSPPTRPRGAERCCREWDEIVTWRAPWIDPIRRRSPLPSAGAVERVAALPDRDPRKLDLRAPFHQSPLPTALVLRQAGCRWIGRDLDDYPGALSTCATGPRRRARGGAPRSTSPGRRLALRRATAARWPSAASSPRPSAALRGRASRRVGARARLGPGRNAALVDALVFEGPAVVVTGAASERRLTAFVAGAPRPEIVELAGMTDLDELAA